MANFKRSNILLTCLCLVSATAAFAKLSQGQLNEAQNACDKALYGTVVKLVGSAQANDYAASLIDARAAEAYDGSTIYRFKHTAQLAPTSSLAAMWNGYSLFLSRKYGQAQTEFNKAIKADPKNALAHALLGCSYCFLDDTERGVSEMKKAQQIAPKASFDEWFARGYVGAGESKQAEPYFNKLVAQNPNSARIYILRADFLDEAGKFHQSLADYDKAIQLSPNSQYAHFRKAHLLRAHKMYKELIPDAIKGGSLEHFDEFGDKSKRILAEAYEQLKDYRKAVEVLKAMLAHTANAMQLSGNEKIGLLQLAQDYEKVGDFKSGKAAVDIVCRVDPKSTEAISLRARLLLALNESRAALHDYDHLIGADASNPQWYLERAKVYAKLGKPESAAADLKKAKQLE